MKKIIFYALLLLGPLTLTAQGSDLNVTAYHVLGNSPGSLFITVSSAFTPPFTLTVTGPGGYTLNTTLNTNTFSIPSLPSGEYCVSITNQDGCVASLCIKIKQCKTFVFHGTSFISCFEEAPAEDPTVLYARGIRLPGSNGFEFNLLLQEQISDSETMAILNAIDLNTAMIEQDGYSPYDINYQNEVDGEGYDYVYKMNTDASIIWVYHNANIEARSHRSSYKETEIPFSVSPNPTSDFIQVTLNNGEFSNYAFSVTNLAGQTVIPDTTPSEQSFIINTNDWPSGMYLLRVSAEKFQKTVKIVAAR
ncbi:MAG: T9SS type A sorting domain-containing protein [Crocinitomicaceae bacterium]|nr:T9SS type A sorting domain-containing protein [Crocinitomicaceae bacterium]